MSRRSMTVVLVAGALGFPSTRSLGAPAVASVQEDPPVVRLVVDTSGMFEDDREDTAQWIRKDGLPVLADAGLTVDDANAAFEIHVAVSVEGVGYAVETSVWKRGATEPEVDRGRRVCDACVRSEVLRLVTRDLAWVGGWLASRPAEPEPTPANELEASNPTTNDRPSREAHAASPPVDRSNMALRNAGLGLVVPGGVALGVGIGLIAAGLREVENPNGDAAVIAERNYRPAGVVVAVVGGTAAAAGVALLIAHVRGSRKERDLRISPIIGTSHAGLGLGARF